MFKSLILFVCFSCLMKICVAQKIFSEGVIKYDVFVNGSAEADGSYFITVKNEFTKRELVMNNGYDNIVIYDFNHGTSISLNIDKETKYALSMKASEVQKSNERFQNARFVTKELTKKLCDYTCTKSLVTYANGDSAEFYFTNDLLPPNEAFNNMFPGLQGIPLEYEVKSNTSTIKLVAVRVETKSIDQNVFVIPKDYKMVTREELEKIK